MVEGCKVSIKVTRIQSLKGQALLSMIVNPTQASCDPLTRPMLQCIGMVAKSVWCLGKELFLTMTNLNTIDDTSTESEKCIGIRIHFGMAGSERLIQTSTLQPGHHQQNLAVTAKNMMPKTSRKKWTACLIFENQTLFLYDSTLCTKTSNYLDNALKCLELDVMSFEKFSVDSVLNKIRNSDQRR
jgi:formamidopyrimidine-DNA glycosylase